MTIDLHIGWNDLSKECQTKIKQLHEKFGGKNVKLHYPDSSSILNREIRINTSGSSTTDSSNSGMIYGDSGLSITTDGNRYMYTSNDSHN